MYFCPNCSYILDIGKTSKLINEEIVVIKKVNDLFALIDAKKDLTNYKLEIQKEEILNSKKYAKIDQNYKTILENIFNNNVLSTAEFKCNNCNYKNQIVKTTLLYNIDLNEVTTSILTYDEAVLMTQNPLLPHTTEFVCINNKCESITNNKIKDAVFYKNNKSYNVNYICTVCFHNWNE